MKLSAQEMMTEGQEEQKAHYQIRDIVQDGNEFYVFMSLELFNVHGKARMIRDVLNGFFCFNVFHCSAVAALPDDAHIADSVRKLSWFKEWEMSPESMQAADDYDSWDAAARKFVRANAREGFATPIRVACALMSVCYNMTVRLYTYSEKEQHIPPGGAGLWARQDGATQISLMLERDSGQLRLITGGRGPAFELRHPGPTCVTSRVAKDASKFMLMGYSPETRTAFEVASFVSPVALGIRSAPPNVHVLPIDAQRMPPDMKCSIAVRANSGKDIPSCMYIIAIRGERGNRTGTLINYWNISFAAPMVEIQKLDSLVVIVETTNAKDAVNVVQNHFGCSVVGVGGEGKLAPEDDKKK